MVFEENTTDSLCDLRRDLVHIDMNVSINFSAIDKRAQNSIMLDAQSEGIAVWDRDIDRYLHSNRVDVYKRQIQIR